MPHNLFQDRMAWVDEKPWHKLGQKVPEYVSPEEMIVAANLSWKVERSPAPGARLLNPKQDTYDRYVIERDPIGEENATVMLGLVGSRYVPLQNTEAFAFFEPFITN